MFVRAWEKRLPVRTMDIEQTLLSIPESKKWKKFHLKISAKLKFALASGIS